MLFNYVKENPSLNSQKIYYNNFNLNHKKKKL
jgi:hypothetical protein